MTVRTPRHAKPYPLPDGRQIAAVLTGFMAVNAFGGAWYAFAGAPGVPTTWLEGTPFTSYLVPGLILGIAVGGTQGLSAVTLWRRTPRAGDISLVAAAVLLGWIVTQLAIIGFVSPLQPIVFVWALAALCLTATALRS